MYTKMNSPTQGSPLSMLREAPKFGPRRRSVRHRVHSPAYASFDDTAGGMVLDLTEIIDLSEAGMLIKAAAPLVPDRSLNFVLDLSETKTYINASGHVVWSDDAGRAGIQFSGMPDYARRRLKEWLFVNALSAFAKGTAKAAIAVREEPEVSVSPGSELQYIAPDHRDEFDEPYFATAVTPSVPTELVADASTLNAIQRRVDELGSDLDTILRVLVENAQSLTRAAGAAIALGEGREMVCRASSGEAPPVGARLHIGFGFSGECVRTAKLLRCDDTYTDPVVDRQSCEQLGIRSMVAAPILADARVTGLLEVFSSQPFAFGESDSAALHRLAEIISRSVRRPQPTMAPWPAPVPEQISTPPSYSSAGEADAIPLAGEFGHLHDDEVTSEVAASFTRNRSMLMALAVTLLIAIIAGVGSWMLRSRRPEPNDQPAPQSQVSPPVTNWKAISQPMTFDELKKRATAGDPMAEYAVGARYAQGEEVKKDYTEAVRWFNKAAEHGHIGAQTALGAYYWAGRGVGQDLSKAYYWSALARAGGDETAKYRVATLASRMSRSQVQDAQQHVDEWLRQHQPSPQR